MKLLKSGALAFSVTLAVSFAVHAAVISWIFGLPAIGLSGIASPGVLAAQIVTGDAPSGLTRGISAGRRSPRGQARSQSQAPEAKGGDASPSVADGAEVPPPADATPVRVNAPAAATADVPVHSADQTAPKDEPSVIPGSVPPVAHVPDPGIMKASRERFYFEIYWLGIYVGKAVMEATSENGVQRITSRVNSAPVISALYKVEDFAESTVRGSHPVRFRIKQREGRYRSDKETIFDSAAGKVTYFDYLKDLKEEHPVGERRLFDVISGFFYLRTRPMDTGTKVNLDIFDSNKFLLTEVDVLRKEQVHFLGRETEAVVVRPVLRSEGLFQSKGDVFIWLTNDERRIPVKVETKVGIGAVVAELKGMERDP